MKLTSSITHFLLGLLFFVFAWFQRNDIDPKIYSSPSFNNPTLDSLLWFLFYAIIAAGFLIQLKKPLARWYFVVAIIACFAEMITTAPGLWDNLFGDQPATMAKESMSAADPRVELTREFFGALIALLGVLYQWKSNPHQEPK